MEPDVLLDVPTLKVDEISLDVEDLHARVALHAAAANLVHVEVGADVSLGKVQLKLRGVEAQAFLKVRLEQVTRILERTLATVEKNPQLLQSILQPVGETVGQLGESVGQVVPELGRQVGESMPGLGSKKGSPRAARRALSRVNRLSRKVARRTGRPARAVAGRIRRTVKRGA